jgi:hypothetical protein
MSDFYSLEHYLTVSAVNDSPLVKKAGEREFIPELTDSEKRALLGGLLGLDLQEPLPPNVDPHSVYNALFSNTRNDAEYELRTSDYRTIELGDGISR